MQTYFCPGTALPSAYNEAERDEFHKTSAVFVFARLLHLETTLDFPLGSYCFSLSPFNSRDSVGAGTGLPSSPRDTPPLHRTCAAATETRQDGRRERQRKPGPVRPPQPQVERACLRIKAAQRRESL